MAPIMSLVYIHTMAGNPYYTPDILSYPDVPEYYTYGRFVSPQTHHDYIDAVGRRLAAPAHFVSIVAPPLLAAAKAVEILRNELPQHEALATPIHIAKRTAEVPGRIVRHVARTVSDEMMRTVSSFANRATVQRAVQPQGDVVQASPRPIKQLIRTRRPAVTEVVPADAVVFDPNQHMLSQIQLHDAPAPLVRSEGAVEVVTDFGAPPSSTYVESITIAPILSRAPLRQQVVKPRLRARIVEPAAPLVRSEGAPLIHLNQPKIITRPNLGHMIPYIAIPEVGRMTPYTVEPDITLDLPPSDETSYVGSLVDKFENMPKPTKKVFRPPSDRRYGMIGVDPKLVRRFT